uniref:Methyltranfer_dom domain-containing protein n=2 Tax=Caenorhabditis japonica TaxID=281687 RepID=A0A8R1I4D4_CAEJA
MAKVTLPAPSVISSSPRIKDISNFCCSQSFPPIMASNMKEKLFNLVVSNVVSNAVNVGLRLNLFKVLAQISSKDAPILPSELAKAAGCKERYIREWCNCLSCGGILEVNEQEKFWIAEENIEDLTNDTFELVTNGMMITLIQPLDKLVSCFKEDGPYGLDYCEFTEFQSFMSQLSKALHEKHVVPDMLPAVGNGIVEKLEAGGIRGLDVGCGNGFHSSLLAEQYPKASFVGLDIGEEAIKIAKQRTKKSGELFNNLEFVECDAGNMPATWTDSFDLVLIFDACHDQCRPDLCIQEIHRVLKPGAVFAMVEVTGTSNVFTDRQSMGPLAALMYGCSMFHCLPVGSNRPDALCMGAMWGQRRAVELLNKCGFEYVQVVETPYFPINIMYLAVKN